MCGNCGGLEGEGDRSFVRVSKEKPLKVKFSVQIYGAHYLCHESFILTESGRFLTSSSQWELIAQLGTGLLSLMLILIFTPVRRWG